jgi:hypothetical protein
MSLHAIIPKLPSRALQITKSFYEEKLNFRKVGGDYPDYLMMMKDNIEIHFFRDNEFDPLKNDGMCYIRIQNIDEFYQELKGGGMTFVGKLEAKPWGQKEFAIIDPDHNLLTFGERI